MKQTAWKRTLSLLLAVVMCIGMVPAMTISVAAKQDEVFADDFSLYPVGADTFWQSPYYTEFSQSLHNTPNDASYATYGIADEGGNKVLELTSVNETFNWCATAAKVTGERTFSVDIKFPQPSGESVSGAVFDLLHGYSVPGGATLVYIDAKSDVRLTGAGQTIYMKNAYGENFAPNYDTWYSLEISLTEGQMILKMWLKGQTEPADDDIAGVCVLESDALGDAAITSTSTVRIMNRSRNRAGEAYTTRLDNVRLTGTKVAGSGGAAGSVEKIDANEPPKGDVVFSDDMSVYPVGEDTFWRSRYYTDWTASCHSSRVLGSYALYNIVEDSGNKVLELVSENKTYNWFLSRDKVAGERTLSLDLKFKKPIGSSVPGMIFDILHGNNDEKIMVYIDAKNPVRLVTPAGEITMKNDIGMGFSPDYDTWYSFKLALSKGQLLVKMWPRGQQEPAADSGKGVSVFKSDTFDDAFLKTGTQVRFMSRARNQAGREYTVYLDNIQMRTTGVGLTMANATADKAGTKLTPVLTGVGMVEPAYTWESSDPSVIRVEDGVAYAVKPGKATVTAKLTHADGTTNLAASCEVTADATGIDPTAAAKQYNVGDTVPLAMTRAVSGVKWASADPIVATVDASGKVTCKSRGVAKITATWTDRGKAITDSVTIQVGKAVKNVKYLAIGDDYAVDTAFYLKKLDLLYPEVNFDIAVLHVSGISIESHAKNAVNDVAAYALYTTDASGNLVKSRDKVTISEMIDAEEWDVISVGNQNYLAGYDTAYSTDLKYMSDYIHGEEPGAKFYWPVAWSFADGYDPYDVPFARDQADYQENSLWHYNAIVYCTNRYILNGDWVDGVVPTGVAVQNLRTALGRDLTRDKDRLTNKTGRLVAGVTLFNSLCLEAGYTPDLSLLNEGNVNFLVDGVAQYPDKDYKPSELPKIVAAVKAAFADMADKELTQLDAPKVQRDTRDGVVTVDQVNAPSALRFPDLKKLPDGRLVATYIDAPIHSGNFTYPIMGNYGPHFAISEDNGETWTVREFYDTRTAVEEMNAPGMGSAFNRYELLKVQLPNNDYVVAGMSGDSDLMPVKMDLDNDGEMEDALLHTGTFRLYHNGGYDAQVWLTWIAVDDLAGWMAGEPGKRWADFQYLSGDNKRGDGVQFNDGTILLPTYSGVENVHVYDLKFNPEIQRWEWDPVEDARQVPNLAPEGDTVSIGEEFNEFSLLTPDGTDKLVYGFARSSGMVVITRDRGRTWELIDNEVTGVLQPQMTLIDSNRAFTTWATGKLANGEGRPSWGKVFYLNAGWEESETSLIYAPIKHGQGVEQDCADPSCAYLDDGRVLTIMYETSLRSIVGVWDDPNSPEFWPNILKAEHYVPQFTLEKKNLSAVIKTWRAPADKIPDSSYIMEFDLSLDNASSVAEVRMRQGIGVKFSTKGITCLENTCVKEMTLATNKRYNVQLAYVGRMIWGKIWADGAQEPDWAIWCTDHLDQDCTKAASIVALNGSIKINNLVAKIPAKLKVEESVAASAADGSHPIAYDRYSTEGTMTFTSSDPNVVTVNNEGVATFHNPGRAVVTTTISNSAGEIISGKTIVSVSSAPQEVTGQGEKTVIHTDDFSAYPVGDNAFYSYMGPDKVYATQSSSTTGYNILEENGDKFLRMYDDFKQAPTWVMVNKDITGAYSVQLDYRGKGFMANSLYMTMFQKDLSAQQTGAAMYRLEGSIGLGMNEIWHRGPYVTDGWKTLKMVCTADALYAKIWDRGQPEPEAWTEIEKVPGLPIDKVNHFRFQFHSSGGIGSGWEKINTHIDVDNLIITQIPVETLGEFKDVKSEDWFYDAAKYAVENNIMAGYNATTFGPNDKLSRAMVVQMLYNKEGKPDLNGATNNFTDVPATEWFNNAVTWGASKSVVSGFGGNVFKPNESVTLEQVAVILHNYSGKPAGNGELSDIGAHSDWAADALKWAVEQGLFDGIPFIHVTETATRAQTAQILMKYLSK
ncbi:MAG: DUF4886 domain-containing protein [Oscillospiraceae bacterium]|nr:DUF4886 domain-containing protein [Oscillospiraceae bacterium]